MALPLRSEELTRSFERRRLSVASGDPLEELGDSFSGAVFVAQQDDGLYQLVYFRHGREDPSAVDPVVPFGEVVVDGLHRNYSSSTCTFNGHPFTGVEVQFDAEGWMWQARVIENGQDVDWFNFDCDGLLVFFRKRSFHAPESDLSVKLLAQSASWSSEGQVVSLAAHLDIDGVGVDGSFARGRHGYLASVWASPGYFRAIEEVDDQADLPVFAGLEALDGVPVGALEFWVGFGDRGLEIADWLIDSGALEEAKLLHIDLLDSQAQLAMERLRDSSTVSPSGVFVTPDKKISHVKLLESLCEWRRHSESKISIENLALRSVAELADSNLQWKNKSALYFDENFESIVGVQNWRLPSDELLQLAVDSPALRFVRWTREQDEQLISPLIEQRPDIEVYGSDIEPQRWDELVWTQLVSEGIVPK